MVKKRPRLPKEKYIEGILEGNRIILSQAITLIESQLPDDNLLADEIIEALIPYSGKSLRVGITGVPGVGKSTFIEAMGNIVATEGKKLAILAIDPSSQKTKGSIMGDKTRMETLSRNKSVFIRPSPTGKALGGVASKTRESMILCEAAGFDTIFVETVGVGQSEITVKGMVDFFLLLALAGAGDELQGIKKGIVEMADAIVINKADGENKRQANKAKADFQSALHLFPVPESGWSPKVMTCSALEKTGLVEIWHLMTQYQQQMTEKGFLEINRQHQNIDWFDSQIMDNLGRYFYHQAGMDTTIGQIKAAILEGKTHPKKAAYELTQSFIRG